MPKVQAAAKKKEPSKRAAAKKKTTAKSAQISDDSDDGDFEIKEIAPPAAKKGGGRKAAANAKTTKTTKKQEPVARLGQKLITQMLEPTENSGISPEKKVRKIRESPFNKKSGSMLGRKIGEEEEEVEAGNEGKMMGSASSETTDEEVGRVLLARGRSQRTNRTQVRYVVSDSDSEPVYEDSDFDEEADLDED